MQYTMEEEGKILMAAEAGIHIGSLRDVSDTIAAAFSADGLILTEEDLAQEFFELRSGLAGELFQKCMNYGLRLAIVLPNPEAYGERFSELAYEHTSHKMIRFVRTKAEAEAWLRT
jgi:hypothetical protein